MPDGAPLHPPEIPQAERPRFTPSRSMPSTAPLMRRTRLQQAILDPRRLVRWVYLSRLSVATAIFLAAQLVWASAPAADTRVASLIFAVTMVVTAISATYTEVYRAPMGQTFLYLQATYDLLLVTAVVHLTGGGASQFTLFYI